ncbi:MAG: KpsF/GutQ family sugar-phosphate isomerase [Chitinophagaceae bacterium]|jgi:arabinose-5-phosphate isomerase|nr:KpsF/GutQ family sugar-phosphate isomerase [Chitinophagaceae bacterium]MBP6045487.1 KpsF/GutQ family sugar-phosphate isomerase [Ferruginibacter sp.]NMD29972.1 KpsF/GutQ family sugar-phosphate isomerase [Bacteroidota bacterium]MBK7089014.1 KpsF/GutQ family sugar-phosphate isomerase [Chitinophagaceae bacterium]MBK7347822.1 KpsF/GutQ family sugar-phosphate isomerase [Chitinophagaceae bacterium]
MKYEPVITSAKQTIALQAEAIAGLAAFVNEDFCKAVERLSKPGGRLIISGIGKSALVAQKIVATMNSTGTPSIFMHAADAIHGDLGMIQQSDNVMIVSKSGDSPEIKILAPLIKNFGNILIGMVGNVRSYLATHSDIVLNTTVSKEACPNNLAPTTSTTAQMVMGDALAVCLMEARGFKPEDFAKYHPGGALGKKLFLRVADLARLNEKPLVKESATVKEVLVEITAKRLGTAAVVDVKGKITGIITDGDIRRMLEKQDSFISLTAIDIMGSNPKIIEAGELAINALEKMRQNNISQLLVINEGVYAGVIHLHDLIREGII